MSEMETSISRISTAREEKHRHHGESHDCTGPRPPRPVWNSVKPGFNQHFPHEFVWKITVKTCKNPNLMVNHVFSLIDCYLEGISYFQTAEWLMIYELFRNVSHVSWGFLDHKASPKLTVR
jgi:hypothetical protein